MKIIMNVDYAAKHGEPVNFQVQGEPAHLRSMACLIGSGIQVTGRIHFDMRTDPPTNSLSVESATGYEFADNVSLALQIMAHGTYRAAQEQSDA